MTSTAGTIWAAPSRKAAAAPESPPRKRRASTPSSPAATPSAKNWEAISGRNQPRAETPVYTARRDVVFDRYRKGTSTATTYPEADKAKISETGK